MEKFGFQTANTANHGYGENQRFDGAVNKAIDTFIAGGIQADNNLGIAIRQESAGRTMEQRQLIDQAFGSEVVSGTVRNIVATLNFRDNPSDDPSAGGLFANCDMTALKARAESAAKLGFALAAGAGSHAGRELTMGGLSSGSQIVNGGQINGSTRLSLRQEAFNNIDLRRSVAFSMGFNAGITRQTDTVMAWFPPVFINPDQTTVEISISPLTVFNGVHHDISAAPTDFARRNVVRAFADGTILSRHETQMVPVARAQNASKLVDVATYPNFVYNLGRRQVTTNFIKFNEDVNLLSLSATDALLGTGPQNQRDTIEPGAKLQWVLAKSGDDIIRIPVLNLKTTNFIGVQQGDQYEMQLSMRSKVAFGKNLKRADGSAITDDLKGIVDNDWRVSFMLNMSGTINTETGNAKVLAPSVMVMSIVNADTGEEVPAGAGRTTVENAVKGLTFLGWFPQAFRTNANRRQTGDRINTRRFNYHYVVPYRDPITAERPAHKQEDQDAQDLTNLLSLTRIRIDNEAIDKIVETAEHLESFVDNRVNDADDCDIVGLSQFFLLPTFHKKTLNMVNELDSIKSSERAKDIQAVLTTHLRDTSSRLYTESQWKAATDVQSGGTLPAPQLMVLTDPIIARYLLEPGDLRTAGDFELVVTTTLNYKVRGKMFLAFRIPGQEASNEPCIFNFGHLFTSPELVLAANMTREGSYFAETQVQPRYELAVMTPVMAVIEVTNIPEILSKVPGLTKLTSPISIDGVVQMEAVTP